MNEQNICKRYNFSRHELDFFKIGNGVAAHHWPTGKRAYCNTHKDAHQNKCLALKQLNDLVDFDDRWRN